MISDESRHVAHERCRGTRKHVKAEDCKDKCSCIWWKQIRRNKDVYDEEYEWYWNRSHYLPYTDHLFFFANLMRFRKDIEIMSSYLTTLIRFFSVVFFLSSRESVFSFLTWCSVVTSSFSLFLSFSRSLSVSLSLFHSLSLSLSLSLSREFCFVSV